MTIDPALMSPEFAEDLLNTWLPGAMFPTELVWLSHRITRSNAHVVIECGRQDGVSTWALGSLLGPATMIFSIDFDDDAQQLSDARQRLDGLNVECVSGDIHVEVPRLIAEIGDQRVAVIQDGPKGWEGLATLVAAGLQPSVALIAQHNLHHGHRSRTAFQMLGTEPSFLEDSPEGPDLSDLRGRETAAFAARAANRPLDHTSLGVHSLDHHKRLHLLRATQLLRPAWGPWDPVRIATRWQQGDYAAAARIRRRLRYSPARFQRR